MPVVWLLVTAAFRCHLVTADDRPQWGERYSRNMVASETNLPSHFDPESAQNIRWSIPLGTCSYATPVVANGKVLIGTNNGVPRDPRHQGDRGVLMCFNELDGTFCWQLVVPKLAGDVYLDWPEAGICSPPTVEGDRVYVVSNRAEVLCLDLEGQQNGNQGPWIDEGQYQTPQGESPVGIGPLDADILWRFDMPSGVGMYPHDEAHSSILIDGQYLYINTGNGVDNTHRRIRAPEAPSLIVLDKTNGQLVAVDDELIGPRIFHCTWSSPAIADVNGRRLVFFCGGDGVCYAFDALEPASVSGTVAKLNRVWRFDPDPMSPKEDVQRFLNNRREGPSNIKGMPVFYKNRIYVAVGGDIWWGKNKAWLECIDATQTGDITETGRIWSYPLERHSCSTPSIADDLVFVADCGGKVHCVDANTGQPYWVHDAGREIWSSTCVADGKVFVGTRRGDFWILAAGREKKVLSSIRLDDPIHGTPVAANGTLFVPTMSKLYAIQAD